MRRLSTAGLLLTLVALAGCGSSSSSSSTTSSTASTPAATTPTTAATSTAATGGALKLAANPQGQLKYDTTSLTAAKSGKVTIDFTNVSPVMHNMTIATSSGTVVGATPTFTGGTKALTVDLKPGTYVFYCSVPGHRQAGMQGTLVVK